MADSFSSLANKVRINTEAREQPDAPSSAIALALVDKDGNTISKAEVDAALAGGVNLAVASQAEAEAGSLNTRQMTPLRTAEAITALALPVLHTGGADADRLAVMGAKRGDFFTSVGRAEVFTVVCGPDVATSLNNTYFMFYVGADQFYAWFNVDAGGSDPSPGGTGIEVAIVEDDAADDVAAAVMAAVNTADVGVTVTIATATLTFTAAAVGVAEDAADDGATGFTIATTMQGVGAGGTFTLIGSDATESSSWQKYRADVPFGFRYERLYDLGPTALVESTTQQIEWSELGLDPYVIPVGAGGTWFFSVAIFCMGIESDQVEVSVAINGTRVNRFYTTPFDATGQTHVPSWTIVTVEDGDEITVTINPFNCGESATIWSDAGACWFEGVRL